jgi:hypothetical protein
MKKEQLKENMSLLRQAGREGVQESAALGVTAATRVASLSREAKAAVTLTLFAAIFFLGSSNLALAAANNCGGRPAQRITTFISNAATFMIAIGGVGALLMFAVGAAMIIFAVQPQYKSQGMGYIKNAIIGLVILVSGLFIKEVLLQFVEGATGGTADEDCAKKNLDGQR